MSDLVGHPKDRFSLNEAHIDMVPKELMNSIIKEYRKVPEFSDARQLCCNLTRIQTKRPNFRVFCQKMQML